MTIAVGPPGGAATQQRKPPSRAPTAAPDVADGERIRRNTGGVGRVLLRFANCRLLLPPGDASGGGDALAEGADLLVDVDEGSIAGVVFASRREGRGSEPAGGGVEEEEKKEEDEDGVVRAGDAVVETVDCRGGVLSPGFIDIQINGAFGVDFSDPAVTAPQVRSVARRLVAQGVTSFCPTLISCSRDTYRKVIPTLGRLCEVRGDGKGRDTADGDAGAEGAGVGAAVLGLHLEGPFFAPAKRGAHPAPHILDPGAGGLPSLLDAYGLSDRPFLDDGVRIVTLAPEREGALSAAAGLSDRGVVVAMGHTEATLEEAERGVREGGATLITHLFNAMRPFHHREPGMVGILTSYGGSGRGGGKSGGSAAERDDGGIDDVPRKEFRRPHWSVIADGIHVHPCAVRMARCAHPEGAVLVTDAMAAMGLGDGVHSLGGTAVEIEGGRATVAGTDTLAGSVSSMDECVRRYREFARCGTAEALRCATLHPARVLGIDGERGLLERGCCADLVLLDEESLEVVGTWVRGRRVYEADCWTQKERKRRRVEGTTSAKETVHH